MITADENFSKFEHVFVGKVHLTRGFSSFQFLPGNLELNVLQKYRIITETNDTLIVALKTEEVKGLPLATYSIIFGIDGTVYMDETKLMGNYKMEGIEFVDWND